MEIIVSNNATPELYVFTQPLCQVQNATEDQFFKV